MTAEVAAIALTVLVHVVGAGALIAVLMRDSGSDWRGWWPRDEGGSGPEEPLGPEPPPTGDDGLPMPGATPAGVRLREPARIAEAYPRPQRRPAHLPEREPEPERTET